jgi:hypothetical protein
MKKIRLLAIAGLFVLSASAARAITITEDFAHDPALDGWQVFGDTNLFQWNSTNQNLGVTWDSTKQNSYFYLPLDTILAKDDGFTLSFDLRLNDVAVSNYGQQVALGLLNFSEATNAAFSRPAADSPDLFEFDYFPDAGYGNSIDATLADMTVNSANPNDFYFAYDNLPLQLGVTYQITLAHDAGTTNITGEVLTNGVLYTALPQIYAGPITDFRLDTLSVSSYADDGSGDDILAHGMVDNFTVTLPPPPVQNLSVSMNGNIPQIQFTGRTNWLYTLQRTTNLQSWTEVSPATAGVGGTLILSDSNAPSGQSFYRIRADRP